MNAQIDSNVTVLLLALLASSMIAFHFGFKKRDISTIKISFTTFGIKPLPLNNRSLRIYVHHSPLSLSYDMHYNARWASSQNSEYGQFYLDAVLYQNVAHYEHLVDSIERADIIFVPFFSCVTFQAGKLTRDEKITFLKDIIHNISKKIKKYQLIYFEHNHPAVFDHKLGNLPCIGGSVDPYFRDKRIYSAPYFSYQAQIPVNLGHYLKVNERIYNIFVAMGKNKNKIRSIIADALEINPVKNSKFIYFHSFQPNFREILFSIPYNYDLSIFSLIPAGYDPSSKRFFDAIFHGTIPIVISPNYIYPFPNLVNYSKFVISLDPQRPDDLPKIVKELLKHKDYLQELQTELIKEVKKLQFDAEYPIPGGGFYTFLEDIKIRFFLNEPIKTENIPKLFNLTEFQEQMKRRKQNKKQK